jgi:16S rRNA G966 N2-methylase RsmD
VAGRTLLMNLREMGFTDGKRAQVVQRPVRAALGQLLAQGPFDFIFADPPYASAELPWLLAALAPPSLLAPRGCLVVERASRDADTLVAEASVNRSTMLTLRDRRRYGDTSLLFYHPVGGVP